MGLRQETFLDYEGFCDKFKPVKTTDDCYTPENVYDVVRDWAVNEYGLEGREIVRPFWPGGDYECFRYPAGAVVIDNPPFSILSKIVKFYNAQKIDYFLFAPYLTNFGVQGCNHVIAPVSVMYANGANVATSFVTNLGESFLRSAPDLMDAIKAADLVNRKEGKRELAKYEYPPDVITSAGLGYLCIHGQAVSIGRDECLFVRRLDAMCSKGIFGGGYLLSERAAAERAAAERAAAERAAAERAAVERAAAERAAAIYWELSPRERELQRMMARSGK